MKTHRNCIVIVAVAAVLLSSSLSIGASVEVTGDFKLNGAGSGVVFPDGTVQTTASSPTWHQILSAAERFVLVMNNNEAVLDKETGLVWEKSPGTGLNTWTDAITLCFDKFLGGRKGWRLPTIEELASLTLVNLSPPDWTSLPAGHPFMNVTRSGYWSATTFAPLPSHALRVHFGLGSVYAGDKTDPVAAWCVRGGQGVDPH